MEWTVGRARLTLMQADITKVRADAIVNAANAHLAGGGGVDGAIHRAGGPDIMSECRTLGGCPTGEAVSTTAGRLDAQHVIHAVAPRWRDGGHGEPEKLAAAYTNSLRIADELGDRSIAFPSLGTGAYGYPVELAAPVAITAIRDHLVAGSDIGEVIFVLFSERDLSVYQETCRLVLKTERGG